MMTPNTLDNVTSLQGYVEEIRLLKERHEMRIRTEMVEKTDLNKANRVAMDIKPGKRSPHDARETEGVEEFVATNGRKV